jgi:hypothetical protein
MHQNIRPPHEPMQLILLVAQVERHSSLVRIQIQKESAFFWVNHPIWERAASARWITARLFDFDDIRAEVSHQLGSRGGRYHRPQLHYFHTFKSMHVDSPDK